MVRTVLFFMGLLAVLSGCQPRSDRDGETTQGRGSGAEPRYETPVRLTSGEYVPPWAGEEGHARAVAAAQAQEEKPLFAGVLNGIRVYTPTDGKAFRRYCTKGAVESFRTTDRLTFGYLPPGTFAETPQYEGLCPDGSVAFIVQQFGGAYFGLTIAYEPGEHAVPSMASADRVSATTVGGRPALAIQPATPEGFGRSAVVVALPTGLLKVEADGLPFAQTRKIAEGVRCERC